MPRKHPNPDVQKLSRMSLASLRKKQDLVIMQLQMATTDTAVSKLQKWEREIQSAIMWKEFGEVI